MSEQIRVFLCDDVAELRILMRYGLEEEPDMRVIGEAEDGEQCAARIGEVQPDVVLLDLSMPRFDGLEAIPRIMELAPRTAIVILSGFASERMGDAALQRGADRYLEKGVPLDAIRQTIREVVEERRKRQLPRAS